MEIKEPRSDNAAAALFDIAEEMRQRFEICQRGNHDFVSVIYMSSLIISRWVSYSANKLLDLIPNIGSLSPSNFVWVVRTTSPKHFPGAMQTLQSRAVNYLRASSYLLLHGPTSTFLNHAKFVLSYHVCFSERVAYHGKYFGSADMTTAGLGYQRGRPGNYEEFQSSYRHRRSVGGSDLAYLTEAKDLARHAADLQSSPGYLRAYVREHIEFLDRTARQAEFTLQGTTRGELFLRYVDLQMAQSRTVSVLDELPGRNLTKNLLAESLLKHPAPNPFELEMLDCNDESSAEVASLLGFDEAVLRNMVVQNIAVVNDLSHVLREEYLPRSGQIAEFRDEIEGRFIDRTKKFGDIHQDYLSRIIELAKSHHWPEKAE